LAHTFDVNVPQLLLWKTMFLDKRFFLVGRNFCMKKYNATYSKLSSGINMFKVLFRIVLRH